MTAREPSIEVPAHNAILRIQAVCSVFVCECARAPVKWIRAFVRFVFARTWHLRRLWCKLVPPFHLSRDLHSPTVGDACS